MRISFAWITSVLRAVHSRRRTDRLQQLHERLGVADARDVLEGHLVLGEERGGDDGEGSVLVARRFDGTGEAMTAFHDILH